MITRYSEFCKQSFSLFLILSWVILCVFQRIYLTGFANNVSKERYNINAIVWYPMRKILVLGNAHWITVFLILLNNNFNLPVHCKQWLEHGVHLPVTVELYCPTRHPWMHAPLFHVIPSGHVKHSEGAVPLHVEQLSWHL